MTGWDLYDHSFLFFSFPFFLFFLLHIPFWINSISITVIVMTILHLLCTCHGAAVFLRALYYLFLFSPHCIVLLDRLDFPMSDHIVDNKMLDLSTL